MMLYILELSYDSPVNILSYSEYRIIELVNMEHVEFRFLELDGCFWSSPTSLIIDIEHEFQKDMIRQIINDFFMLLRNEKIDKLLV